MKKYQVIIVGGGPVGVALAVQLGMRDISCMLVESRTDLGRIPKGQNLTHRTLETFYFMGLVDELRAVRLMPPGFAIGEITTYRDLNSPYFHATKSAQDAHGVKVAIEKGDTKETWEADYVVGCDGGHSLVREQIGIPRSGT